MKYLSILMKNVAQVLLLENAWTGLLVIVALLIGDWKVGLVALIASVIALLLAKHTNYSRTEIDSGLAGFNPVLTGVALTLFLEQTWYSYIIIIVAIVITMPVGAAIRELFKTYDVPMLTIPYVFVSWSVLLMSFQFKFVNVNVNILPQSVKKISFSQNAIHFMSSFLSGFSEVFLLKSTLAGLLILIGIFVASRKAGFLAIMANLIGFIMVLLLGANHSEINDGLFGYNVILTVLALGVAFKTRINRYINIILGILLTIFLHAGLTTLLTPFGLPVFTLPFIIATWTILLAGTRMKKQTIEEHDGKSAT
ncbi:urea transporter [Staphylococcus kloosii]|uniref:Urea transporter n=1 Tax=Staphylococcus kloosii TaxID=29384 RepID=A0A921GXJ2_9STAP|nr:urea transporter [Staphylococcus kloosii]AVQ35213.1 urea transporter [Staphylococcus kloosii]MBF7021148.1 urea transporter [Staphylococcus kloosii]PNZ05190.1 urea transporter [Staphylococcus kloosii]PTJ79677.1 urea transporter [Staphylococcus kloosii]SUM48256.1 Urea transporter [Staphylococcus kloosii]